MLSIFIHQQKYLNQLHRVCLQLIEQAIANVGKYLCCQQFRIDRIKHVKYINTFPNLLLTLKYYQNLNVEIFISKFEGKCK